MDALEAEGQDCAARDEWYIFDRQSGRIREIRAYYASSADSSAPIAELVEFDYAGRGYHMQPP